MIIDFIDNVTPFEINNSIVNSLCQERYFTPMFSSDGSLSSEIEGGYSDLGFILQQILWEDDPVTQNTPRIRAFGDLLVLQIFDKSKIEFTELRPLRYYWNYYNTASVCLPHRDGNRGAKEYENVLSGLMFLNDCDASFFIEDNDGIEREFPSISGNALLFESEALHRASAPKQVKRRFTFNFQFAYRKLKLKK